MNNMVHGSRLTAHGSRLTAHGSRLTAHDLSLCAKTKTLTEAVDEFHNITFTENNENSEHKEIKTIGTYFPIMYDGGVQRVLSGLCYLWVNMGYNVVLYTQEPPDKRDYPYPDSVKRIVIPPEDKLEKRLSALEKSFKEEKIDVFVQHAWLSSTLLWEILLAKNLNIHFVLHNHGFFALPYKFPINDPYTNTHRIFNMCDVIVALSNANHNFYRMCGCVSYLIQNPIQEKLKNLNNTANLKSHKILWIGRISPEKRLLDAVKIFELVHKKIPDATLEVVGRDSGNYLKKVLKYCKSKDFMKNINFHGYQTDVGKFYSDAALMLMTSEMEGYPYILLESKAYGLPIVMYSLPYLSLVQDGKGIRTAKIGDIEKMSEHVCDLLSSDELRFKLGREARESFENIKNYDYEGNWRRIFELAADKAEQQRQRRENFETAKVIDMLLNEVRVGIDKSREYKLGRILLKIPRIVVRYLRKIKSHL